MAKNLVSEGQTVDFVAPAAGALSGVPLALNDLVLVPLSGGPKGVRLVGRTDGEWFLPASAGLKQGQKVNLLAGTLVAPATPDSVPFGKLTSDATGGFASALLIQ
jgi:predicted RecA/RadA family phage recombinase